MTNTRRPLENIAEEIHALERGNAFAIGALLTEARENAEYGEWSTWLESEFDWSEDTARNYMAAHRLGEQFRTVRDLPLPMRAVYRLGNDFEPDDAGLPIVIEALTTATKGKSKVISVAEADDVIDMTLLRIEHGNYPDATLTAIDNLSGPWTASASEALKDARPTTAEEAKQITDAAQRAHLVALYAPYGGLPDDLPDDALWSLEQVSEKDRSAVLEKIKCLARPLTEEAIMDCVYDWADDDVKAQERQEAITGAADRAAERAAEEAARQSASKAQQLPGATSPAEIERKLARLEELEPRVAMLERMKLALESENEELKAAKAPIGPSLMEALETALNLAREAARHNGGLSPGKAKKREKVLNDIRSGIALLMELEKEAAPQKSITADPPEMRM